MSAIEETKSEIGVQKAGASVAAPSVLTKILDFLSSVRFGVGLLIALAVACMIGMVVMQQNIEGFDKYYFDLSPATRLLFGTLGFFDIYHAWYFNVLLLVLSLNIVLASIDRFPKAWTFISKPKLDASAHWLRGQEQTDALTVEGGDAKSVAERVEAAFKSRGLKTVVTEKAGKVFVFGQRGTWNRLGAYAVHVALLTIFTGGFLTAQFGFTGNMSLVPGGSADRISERVLELDQPKIQTLNLPFTVECTDIQQKLIKKDGPITADNTLDWLTTIRITDPVYGEREGVVHMNTPLDFTRGWFLNNYRFFQASFVPDGKARSITLRIAPEGGGAVEEVTIPRDGTVNLSDGTRIEFQDFSAQFALGREQQMQGERVVYTNPAATLLIHPPTGAPERAFAFTPAMAENAPFAKRPVLGKTYRLIDFEKVPAGHILSVQWDPGATIVYVGFGLLGLTLCAVFFFSHQRVWAHVAAAGVEGNYEVVLGGNTNRNKLGFEDRFKKIVEAVRSQTVEVK